MIYTHNRFSLLSAGCLFCWLVFFQQSYAACSLPRLTFAEPVALVIANSEYANTLRQSINDANAMKTVLEEIGFRVIFKTELDKRAMNKATVEFRDCLRISRGVGLFYFTGYGMQLNRKNYLLPINISIADKEDVKYDAFPVEKLFERLRGAKNDVNIVILDACRDSPYPLVGNQRGLANVASRGSLIAYPTEAGKTILDQRSQNSLYISTLITALKMAVRNHTRIEDVFMQVSNQVEQKSDGQQIPREQNSLNKKFCFGGCKTQAKIIDLRKTAKLIVYSNTNGAIVFINGKNSGSIQNGMFKKELPVGNYTVRVEKPSDVSEVKTITLQKTQRIEINLEPLRQSAPKPDTNKTLLPPSVGF
jgi:hypothetical protein